MLRRLALLIVTSLAATGSASAHAHLVNSAPADGSTLVAPPASVTLTFSEAARVTACFVQKNAEPRRAIASLPTAAASTVTIGLPVLPDGAYTLSWRVVGADSHVMSGELQFTIAQTGANAPSPHP